MTTRRRARWSCVRAASATLGAAILVDPLATAHAPPDLLSTFEVAETHPHDSAALKLAKLVGLLPAAVVARLEIPPMICRAGRPSGAYR